MTSDPPEPHGQLDLSYLAVSGEQVSTQLTIGERMDHAPASLIARAVLLTDNRPARQLTVNQAQLPAGYQHLDNEILAGLWLYRTTRSRRYPAQISRLIGYVADSADPFALLDDYRGEPTADVAGHLTPAEQRSFHVSLMTGLRWLAEAGLAHCAIGLDTVRWDGDQVQITDFSQATVIGAGRSTLNRHARQAPGLRAGPVTDRDDVWAALLLCYYVDTGQEFTHTSQLANWSSGGELAAEIAGGPQNCQSAHAILTSRLGADDPVPLGIGSDQAVADGRDEFFRIRAAKHPGAAAPFGSSASSAPPVPPPSFGPSGPSSPRGTSDPSVPLGFPDTAPQDDQPAAMTYDGAEPERKGFLRRRTRR